MKTWIVILMALAMEGSAQSIQQSQKTTKMKVAVWDTYVTKKDGSIMHFDIIAPESVKDTAVIYGYGREYLKSKGQESQQLTAKECRLCHFETVRPQWEGAIREKGYYIYEMEGCK
jgi:hypothetical protein